MMKISTFNNKTEREMFQEAALKAIQQVAKQFGLESVQNAGYVYDTLDCTFKFKVMCDTKTSVAQSKNLRDSINAGFSENVVGKIFRDKKHTFTITGFSFGRKNPVDCTRDDGKLFCYNAGFVKTAGTF
jgi:hypothetical protein